MTALRVRLSVRESVLRARPSVKAPLSVKTRAARRRARRSVSFVVGPPGGSGRRLWCVAGLSLLSARQRPAAVLQSVECRQCVCPVQRAVSTARGVSRDDRSVCAPPTTPGRPAALRRPAAGPARPELSRHRPPARFVAGVSVCAAPWPGSAGPPPPHAAAARPRYIDAMPAAAPPEAPLPSGGTASAGLPRPRRRIVNRILPWHRIKHTRVRTRRGCSTLFSCRGFSLHF